MPNPALTPLSLDPGGQCPGVCGAVLRVPVRGLPLLRGDPAVPHLLPAQGHRHTQGIQTVKQRPKF